MVEIVNLRRARKNKKRQTKESEAAAHRAKFGTPKAMRDLAKAKAELDAKKIDAHKIDDSEE
jgi:hypothetical protein